MISLVPRDARCHGCGRPLRWGARCRDCHSEAGDDPAEIERRVAVVREAKRLKSLGSSDPDPGLTREELDAVLPLPFSPCKSDAESWCLRCRRTFPAYRLPNGTPARRCPACHDATRRYLERLRDAGPRGA